MSRVAVIGAGTMGNGIAHVFAQHGWDATLIDVAPGLLERVLATIRANFERQVKKGAVSPEQRDAALARIRTAASLDAVSDAELVVEAATEQPDVKFKIFRELDRVAPPRAILASNTSSISITTIAAQTKRPALVIGMHFMNPVPVMTLVEVIRGLETGDETVRKVVEVVEVLKKVPVVVQDAPGFVSNRVLMPMINEAVFCVMEGVATPEAVDTVMKLGMNHPLGPLALADLIGLDVCLAILEVLQRDLGDDKYRPAPLLRTMVAAGRLGRKSGRGFYVYRD
jgi:3-hydroxybutyryl-CoA dehydrogenase